MKRRATFGGKLVNETNYLASVELDGDTTLTISKVGFENLWREGVREAETKFVLSFEETPKKLILGNRSNEDTIVQLHGDKAEDWVGKQITLYRTTTQVTEKGKGRVTVPTIRIRDTVKPPTIGERMAKSLYEKLDGDVGELQKAMGMKDSNVAEWPKSLVPKVSEWLKGRSE